MEINNDIAHELELVERRFQLPTVEAEPRPGVDINDNTASLECLDGAPWD